MHKKGLKIVFIFSFILFISFISSFFIINNGLPASFSLVENYESQLNFSYPFDLYISKDDNSNGSLFINNQKITTELTRVNTEGPLVLKAGEIGRLFLDLKLFGIIPLRSMEVNVLPKISVMPGGQSIGVMLQSQGVMVVRDSYVETPEGNQRYPAREAGISAGDVILAIDGRSVPDKIVLAEMIQQYQGQGKLVFRVKKKTGEIKDLQVEPVYSKQGRYKIGLFVDDGVSGVGTLTFYEPTSKKYGALGHVITEANNQIVIDVKEGKIVEARISGISYGQRGIPGQKQGTFFDQNNILGNIYSNTRFGIYGVLQNDLENPFFDKPIPVAAISQIEEGPAKTYTVINQGQVEEFNIYIERIFYQSAPDSKGMIINIVDPVLKNSTGGIIQGMSGSPIVQNGRLVGAITHVFVNNPARGYGVFAEWMLLEAGLFEQEVPEAVNF